MRQVVLDTETTGLEKTADRIIEIGCVEIVDRKIGASYRQELNPEQEISEGASAIHGKTLKDLKQKPRFIEILDDFLDFLQGDELIIHNADFDLGFLDRELELAGQSGPFVPKYCKSCVDTYELAKKKLSATRYSLDALCDRYHVNRAQRVLHGALLDAELLAEVYLRMTRGQMSMEFTESPEKQHKTLAVVSRDHADLKVLPATPEELKAHNKILHEISEESVGKHCLWLELEEREELTTEETPKAGQEKPKKTE